MRDGKFINPVHTPSTGKAKEKGKRQYEWTRNCLTLPHTDNDFFAVSLWKENGLLLFWKAATQKCMWRVRICYETLCLDSATKSWDRAGRTDTLLLAFGMIGAHGKIELLLIAFGMHNFLWAWNNADFYYCYLQRNTCKLKLWTGYTIVICVVCILIPSYSLTIHKKISWEPKGKLLVFVAIFALEALFLWIVTTFIRKIQTTPPPAPESLISDV